MKRKITEDTTLAELLKNPDAGDILAKYNFPCLSCPMAKFEIKKLKLGEVCKTYGIDLESLLKELNPPHLIQ
jgi:hybrid cluster-associated redox disulfide protein